MQPKGTVLIECGKLLQRGGYKIKVLNTINFKKSMRYNPFVYIRSEKDVLKVVNTLIVNTKGEGEKSAEDFWVKAERLLYCALIGYIWYEAPAEEMNFTTLLELINASEAREDDEEYQSPVDLLFADLEERSPDHFAVKQYKKYKLAAGAAGLQDGKLHPIFFCDGKGLGCARSELPVHIDALFVRDNALHDFRRAPRCGQAAQNLRADRNHLMPPRKITDRLIVIVSAAVFAVFAQQAGADQNLHCCALRFSDTESFPYSTTLLGIEKEDSAFSYPHTGRSAEFFCIKSHCSILSFAPETQTGRDSFSESRPVFSLKMHNDRDSMELLL